MSERYTRLFTLPKDCYVRHAPVLVEAGALLKDNENGQVIGQLKILNLQDKPIKATTVAFLPFDTAGKVLGQEFEFQYLDLNTKINQTFGEKTPVKFPDSTTRAFLPAVMEVIFEDNSKWKVAPNEVWDPLPKQETLESAFSNPILKIQYQKETTSNSTFCPQDLGEIWRCSCGAVNPSSNGICRACRVSKTNVFDNYDSEHLRNNYEKQEKEEEEHKKQEITHKKKRNLKIALCAGISTIVLIIVLITSLVIVPLIQTQQKYNTALSYASNGEYSQAISIFEELGSYKESETNLANCRFAYLLENGDYAEAIISLIEKISHMTPQDVEQNDIDNLVTVLSVAFEEYLKDESCGIIYKIEYYNSGTALVYCSNMGEGRMTMLSDSAKESIIWMIGITPEEKGNSYLIADGDLITTIKFETNSQGQLVISSIES